MRKWTIAVGVGLLLFLIGVPTDAVASDTEKAASPPTASSDEAAEMMEMAEFLEMIDLLRNMDLLTDFDLIRKEKKDEGND